MTPLWIALIPAVAVVLTEILRDYFNHLHHKQSRLDAIEQRLAEVERKTAVLR